MVLALILLQVLVSLLSDGPTCLKRALSKSSSFLYEFNLAKEDFKQALEFYQKYSEVNDSIYNENSSEQIAQMRTQYETEKKEAEINQLTNEKTRDEITGTTDRDTVYRILTD